MRPLNCNSGPVLLLLVLVSASARASDPAAGQVQLPLEILSNWMSEARPTAPAESGYALGSARARVSVGDGKGGPTATATVELNIEAFDDRRRLIPVLPLGTLVNSVTIAGKPAALSTTAAGIGWSAGAAGVYRMALEYDVPLRRSESGFSLALVLPRAAVVDLECTLPGRGLDVAVIPASGVRAVPGTDTTVIRATIAATGGAQISWRTPGERDHVISRATYSGELVGESVAFTAELIVELLGTSTVAAPVLPVGAALRSMELDGKPATILVQDGHYAALIDGRGRHTIRVDFEVHMASAKGPPRIEVPIVEVPVSRFELTLPGRKTLQVSPVASVLRRIDGKTTRARLHVPLTRRVTIAWSEAVPDEGLSQVQANAETYHTFFAEEGLLFGRALVRYDINRGETNTLRLGLPPGIQLNQVDDNLGAVRDWRVSEGTAGDGRIATLFLDRQLRGEVTLDLRFDAALGADGPEVRLQAPLLRPLDAHRERGMVALLSGAMLTLEPLSDGAAIRVGENQLPTFVRQGIDKTVAHTFKYAGTPPVIVVRPTTPERAQGKFDARVDTLISIGEATLTATSSVQVSVKSGGVAAVRLRMPPDVTLLGLTAPSMRAEAPVTLGDDRFVDIEFTQEMTGQFRLELSYERLQAADSTRLTAPLIAVEAADVEQGRIAVEALSAVEVRPEPDPRLTAVEIGELPRQLVLRTSNPILLAYKYVRGEEPPHLGLEINRHRVLGVQEATIDLARYRTLFTADGLRITHARFMVRNSRKQFLRIDLPDNAEIWSASVDGRAVKPAMVDSLGAAPDSASEILIKIIHSADAFPVELTFANSEAPLSRSGRIQGVLPRPDILVTGTRWDVYLPAGLRYGRPTTNMEPAETEPTESPEVASIEAGATPGEPSPERSLQITVPATGTHLAFDKLYANQGPEDAWFALSYRRSRP